LNIHCSVAIKMDERELKVEALKTQKELILVLLRFFLTLITLLLSALGGIFYKEGEKALPWLLFGTSLLVLLALTAIVFGIKIYRIATEIENCQR